MMRLDLATEAFIGARAQQQDAAAARGFGQDGGAVLVLADGLGGHTGGAEASRIVVEAFREAADAGDFDHVLNRAPALRRALDIANERISRGADPADGHRGMASTAVAAVIADGQVRWISVGDSHLYLWRDGKLAKLNEDHSQAGVMLRTGQYQPTDPEVLAARSVLVSALTGRRLEIVDHPDDAFDLAIGDLLVLASDGLNTLEVDEIEALLNQSGEQSAKEISDLLIDTVRDRRADRQDNTAVVVARIEALPAPMSRADATAVTAKANSPFAKDAEQGSELPRDDGSVPTLRVQLQQPSAMTGVTLPTVPASPTTAGAAAPIQNHAGPYPEPPESGAVRNAAQTASTSAATASPVPRKAQPSLSPAAPREASASSAPGRSTGDGAVRGPSGSQPAARVRPPPARPAKSRNKTSAGLVLAILAGLGIVAAATYVLLTWRSTDAEPAAIEAMPQAAPPALPAKSTPLPSAPAASAPPSARQPEAVAPPKQLPPAAGTQSSAPTPVLVSPPQPVPRPSTAPQQDAPAPKGGSPPAPAPTLTPGADDPAPPGKGAGTGIGGRAAVH